MMLSDRPHRITKYEQVKQKSRKQKVSNSYLAIAGGLAISTKITIL
jgi:hypothetical protein